MQNDHSVAAHWAGDYDEQGLQSWAEKLRDKLGSAPVSMGLVFMTPKFFPVASQVLELLRVHAKIPLLVGCSSSGLIAGSDEVEENAGIVLGLYSLPGAKLEAFHFTQEHVDEATGPAYWHQETGVNADAVNGWIVFADPFHLDCEGWLRRWNEAYPGKPIVGGLASGEFAEQTTQVYHNEQVFEEGGVAIALLGEVAISGVISQGCTPIGDVWTITKAEGNYVYEIGNRPAFEVLVETLNKLSPEEQKNARGNIFVGLVTNEYLDDFGRGDFLVRNLLGADPKAGALAVGAMVRPGQTMQFQKRDAAAGTEDISLLLTRAQQQIGKHPVYGACLCCCNGRGQRLFGVKSHDARHVQKQFGPIGLAGFFCNGEIGPIGDKNFLHGYTASLALFVKK